MHKENSSSSVAVELSFLSLCVVEPRQPLSGFIAAGWFNRLLRIGVALPLFVIHDIGWLLTTPPEELRLRPVSAGLPEGLRQLLESYEALVSKLGESPVVKQTARLELRDELIAVLCSRLLEHLSARYKRLSPHRSSVALPLEPALYSAPALTAGMVEIAEPFLKFFVAPEQALHLLTAVELLDVEMLRLLASSSTLRKASTQSLFDGSGALAATGLVDWVDLLRAVDAPEVRDVVRFALALLPSVLETRRSIGSQHYPVGGYAGIERRGTPNALLESELLNDEDLFLSRLCENELLYHGREHRAAERRGEHHILIDASASMHGLRQVFARGLAIALAERLHLLGATVKVRFFDGRLHEAISIGPGHPDALPYLLSFRSSRGRHYGRVFSDLLRELGNPHSAKMAAADPALPPSPGLVLHLLTHGGCQIPVATVQALARRAELHGIFVLPSYDLSLDYLPLLRSTAVITDEVLNKPETRRAQALGIVAKSCRPAFFK